MSCRRLCAVVVMQSFDEWAADRVMSPMEREFARDAWTAAQRVELQTCIQICTLEADAATWEDGSAARAAIHIMLQRRRS